MSNLSLLKKADVIELFGIASSTLDKWIQERKIPYIKLGKSVRFRASEIDQYLDRRTVKVKRNYPDINI